MDRSDDYMTKITFDALDRHVILDATIRIQPVGGKLKAYCEQTKTFVQFPRDIRKSGRVFMADVIKSKTQGVTTFYRAYRGSIRNMGSEQVIA